MAPCMADRLFVMCRGHSWLSVWAQSIHKQHVPEYQQLLSLFLCGISFILFYWCVRHVDTAGPKAVHVLAGGPLDMGMEDSAAILGPRFWIYAVGAAESVKSRMAVAGRSTIPATATMRPMYSQQLLLMDAFEQLEAMPGQVTDFDTGSNH